MTALPRSSPGLPRLLGPVTPGVPVLPSRTRLLETLEQTGTPCFLFFAEALAAQWARLGSAFADRRVRHWWSCKTLPLPEAWRWWRRQGQRLEVVSGFELQAALAEGTPPSDILVNGPAKHRWLPTTPLPGLNLNFDSLGEIQALARRARRERWTVGLRLNTHAEHHPDFAGLRTQFGLVGDEIGKAVRQLRRVGVGITTVHFHLRTNVGAAEAYEAAARESWERARAAGATPSVLDLGGGFPVENVRRLDGGRFDDTFSLRAMDGMVARMENELPGLRECWLENGRWLTAPAGVLVVRILEVKERRGARVLICDGGRTLQAMVATWEQHAVEPLVPRRGRRVKTLVCGPTCMAFDHLGVHSLPAALRPGDLLLWRDAGAYQLAWETRFSHGAAAVAWLEGTGTRMARTAETPGEWWRQRGGVCA